MKVYVWQGGIDQDNVVLGVYASLALAREAQKNEPVHGSSVLEYEVKETP